jgi:hypothetical protein
MSACEKLVFQNVDQPKFDCISQNVSSQVGVALSGPSGSASKDGFTVTWDFDVTQLTLAIQCTDSPFVVPCSLINSRIHALVAACGVT